MNLLHRFHRTRAPTPSTIVVTLYGRAGCHLCELAEKSVARAVAATQNVALRHVDIDTDDDLRARYGLRIPVVTATMNGEERVLAEGKVSDIRLQRALGALWAER